MLITPEYVELNRELHGRKRGYGRGKHKADTDIKDLADEYGHENILDYGCGKGIMVNRLECRGYDPSVSKYQSLPSPAKIVLCLDVLEHIEPDCLEDVVKHIAELSEVLAVIKVATRPSKKTLSDGRNAHLIVETYEWWYGMLRRSFERVVVKAFTEREFKCFAYPLVSINA